MVISSSPARSNDQSLSAAMRSTTSSGFVLNCSLSWACAMPSPMSRREWVGCPRQPHATHYGTLQTDVANESDTARLTRSERITCDSEYIRALTPPANAPGHDRSY